MHLYIRAVETTLATKWVKRETIEFTEDDQPTIQWLHHTPLVISMAIHKSYVRKILVDTWRRVNALYHKAFMRLGFSGTQLRPLKTLLIGFTNDVIEVEGFITLMVQVGDIPWVRVLPMEFVVVRLECAHNATLRIPKLEDLGAIISLGHLCMKFHTPQGIRVIQCEQ